MKNLFILSWPSGVWKTTLYEEFKKYYPNSNIEKIITTTTRNMRDYEIDWKDYYFVDVDYFKKLINENKLIEYAKVYNNYYWSTYEELNRIIDKSIQPLYIVDPQWVKTLKNKLNNTYKIKTIFILPPSIDTLKKRLLKRGETYNSKSFKIRLEESLIRLNEKSNYDYNILNDDLQIAVDDFKKIIDQNV